jgi:hypothetical protein
MFYLFDNNISGLRCEMCELQVSVGRLLPQFFFFSFCQSWRNFSVQKLNQTVRHAGANNAVIRLKEK